MNFLSLWYLSNASPVSTAPTRTHFAPFSPSPFTPWLDAPFSRQVWRRFSASMLTLISRSRIEFEFSRHWGLSLSPFLYIIWRSVFCAFVGAGAVYVQGYGGLKTKKLKRGKAIERNYSNSNSNKKGGEDYYFELRNEK